MNRRLFAFGAGWAFVVPVRVHATPDLAPYAAILHEFAPRLSAAAARRLAQRVVAESDRAAVDARLIVALVAVESSWDSTARSRAGARGLGQLMPETAALLHVDPTDAVANLHGTVVYVRALLDHYAPLPAPDRFARALAAYNAGYGAVDRYGGIPPYPETQAYVHRVIGLWRRLVLG